MRTFRTKFRLNTVLLNITICSDIQAYRYDHAKSTQWRSPSYVCPRRPYKCGPIWGAFLCFSTFMELCIMYYSHAAKLQTQDFYSDVPWCLWEYMRKKSQVVCWRLVFPSWKCPCALWFFCASITAKLAWQLWHFIHTPLALKGRKSDEVTVQ